MKYKILQVSITLIFIVLATSCKSKQVISKENGIEVNEAFKKVYNATQQALSETENKNLKLESIDLAFETSIANETSVGLKLWVVSGKYVKSKSKSQKVTYSFGRDENVTKALHEYPKIKYFKDYLITVINSAMGVETIDSFGLKEMEVEVDFTLKKSGEGSAEVELLPITPNASFNREKEAVHTITLKFAKK